MANEAHQLRLELQGSYENPAEILPEKLRPAVDVLERGILDGIIPGAVASLSIGDGVFLRVARGDKGVQDLPMTIDTIFDVGAMTGTIVTASLMMKNLESAKFRIDDRVSRFIQGIGVGGKSTTTIAHLLSHYSGLPGGVEFYDELLRLHSGPRLGILASSGAKQYVYDHILKIGLKHNPGEKQIPSDLNFILLGQLAELLAGLPLDRAFQRSIAGPLGLKSTSFIDLSLTKRRGFHPVVEMFAATGHCPTRDRLLCGEVNDLNAWAMGGVAGHSGLFSNVVDLQIWSREMLRAAYGESRIFKRSTIEAFWGSPVNSGQTWHLGWELPSKENGFADIASLQNSIGTTSDTGCSLWLEPSKQFAMILLTNASLNGRNMKRFHALRAEFHSALLRALA